MLETGMGSIWVDKVASSNLLEKTQPLKLLGVNDGHGNSRKSDMAMNTENMTIIIIIYSLVAPLRSAFSWKKIPKKILPKNSQKNRYAIT
jgi:hypothetical protein